MSGRPIVLPDELPEHDARWGGRPMWCAETVRKAQRAAVEADRRGIVVTDDDMSAFNQVYDRVWDEAAESDPHASMGMADEVALRAALESFAARKRGET